MKDLADVGSALLLFVLQVGAARSFLLVVLSSLRSTTLFVFRSAFHSVFFSVFLLSVPSFSCFFSHSYFSRSFFSHTFSCYSSLFFSLSFLLSFFSLFTLFFSSLVLSSLVHSHVIHILTYSSSLGLLSF